MIRLLIHFTKNSFYAVFLRLLICITLFRCFYTLLPDKFDISLVLFFFAKRCSSEENKRRFLSNNEG